MSEQNATPTPPGADEPFLGGANDVMQSILSMDFGEEAEETPGAGGGADANDAGGAGEESTHGTEASPEPTGAGEEEGGADGDQEPAGLPPTPAEPVRPPVTEDAQYYADQINDLGTHFGDNLYRTYQAQALQEAEENYGHYIDSLKMHPMELIGKALPPLTADGDDVVFSTAAEVREWQEAVQTVIRRELEQRISHLAEEDAEVINVVYSSIELFKNNHDLIPNSKGFNRQLADNVARLLKPYELRMDGKLTGYSIDPQGIIDQARGQLSQQPAAPAPAKKAPAKKAAPRPQAGVRSKAGASGGQEEDYTPMWNALGIDHVPI